MSERKRKPGWENAIIVDAEWVRRTLGDRADTDFDLVWAIMRKNYEEMWADD